MHSLFGFLQYALTSSTLYADMRSSEFAIVGDSLAGEQSAAASQGFDRVIEAGQGFVVENWMFILIIGLILIFFSLLGIVRKKRM